MSCKYLLQTTKGSFLTGCDACESSSASELSSLHNIRSFHNPTCVLRQSASSLYFLLCFAGLHDGGTTTYQTGGSLVHNTKAGEYLLLNTEFKTEGGPVCFQNQWYYKTFWGRQSDSPLLQATVAPAFLIDQPGPLFR